MSQLPQVPITQQFLANFYSNYPVIEIPSEMNHLIPKINNARAETEKNSDNPRPFQPHPHKIDENLFQHLRNLDNLLSQHWFKENRPELCSILAKSLNDIRNYQTASRAKVMESIQEMLPNDIRASAALKLRERKESSNKAKIAQLKDNGASIDTQYDLLWDQQLDRRQSLVDIGNDTGVYKSFIKLAGGVPDSVFDFAKAINSDNGPLEAVRSKFAPNLYIVSDFLSSTACAIINSINQKKYEEYDSLFEKSIQAYSKAMVSVLDILSKSFTDFPLFITLEQALEANNVTIEDKTPEWVASSKQKTVSVPGKSVHTLSFDSQPNSQFGWEIKTQSNDIIIKIQWKSHLIEESGVEIQNIDFPSVIDLVPENRLSTHLHPFIGYHTCHHQGSYSIHLDNRYSRWTGKTVNYRLATRSIPQVESKPSGPTPSASEQSLRTLDSQSSTQQAGQVTEQSTSTTSTQSD